MPMFEARMMIRQVKRVDIEADNVEEAERIAAELLKTEGAALDFFDDVNSHVIAYEKPKPGSWRQAKGVFAKHE